MRLNDLHESIRLALVVIAKFGFINQALFFKCLTNPSKSQRYRLWDSFLKTDLVMPYQRIGVAENYYSLNKRGASFLRENGITPVSKSHPLHFEHDEVIMCFAMSCQRKKLIKPDWTSEKQLRQLRSTEVSNRFNEGLEKLPDLIFEIDTQSELKLRCALEVERSRKSKLRYDAMVLNYMKDKNLNLVIVAYKDRYVANSILQSAKRLGYPQSEKPFVFCRINDMVETPTNFMIEIGSNKISFDKYVENIRILSCKKGDKMRGIESPKKSPQKAEAT